jgi:hypothetical protein
MPTAVRKPPTPRQVQEEQERVRAADEARANLPSVVETKLPASSDGRSFHDAYLDAIAPASIAGKMLKFTKEGEYQVVEDESTIGEDVQFIALVPETLIGWIKFCGPGQSAVTRNGLAVRRLSNAGARKPRRH